MTKIDDSSAAPISRFWSKINLMAEIAAVFRNRRPRGASYQKALEMIQSVVPYDGAALHLRSTRNNRLELRCICGRRFGVFEVMPTDPADGIIGKLRVENETALLSRLDRLETPDDESQGACLIIPMMIEETLIGTVSFAMADRLALRDKDIKLLSIIADQIAISIERSAYQKKLEKRNAQLHRTQKDLRAAQQKVIDIERLKAVRQLAVSINHEINNPLSVITGNAEYLLYVYGELDPKIVDRLKIIEHEALRIAGINRRLLEIQDLVTDPYIQDDDAVWMLDIRKSSAGSQK